MRYDELQRAEEGGSVRSPEPFGAPERVGEHADGGEDGGKEGGCLRIRAAATLAPPRTAGIKGEVAGQPDQTGQCIDDGGDRVRSQRLPLEIPQSLHH